MLEVMQKNWWMLVVRGVLACLFGVIVILSPGIALTVMVLLWGAYALVDGVFALIAGFRGREQNKNWWVTVLEGVIGIAAGIVAFLYPGITVLVLLYIIAAWAIITGILEIAAAIRLRREIQGEIWLGLTGVFSILFGILLILFPGTGILSLLWLVAIYAFMFGIAMIVLGFRVRGMNNQRGQTRTPQSA